MISTTPFKFLLLLGASQLLFACNYESKPEEVYPKQPPAGWATKDVSEWPQLVLTNTTEFEGHTSLHGASGFLAKNSKGDIFYATADHLLGSNGGVKPSIKQ